MKGGNHDPNVAATVQDVHALLEALQPGDFLILPATVIFSRGKVPVLFVVHMSQDVKYSFTCCNHNAEAKHFHPVDASDYPKLLHNTALCVADVPKERMVDPAVCYLIANLSGGNGGDLLYEVLCSPWQA